MVNYREILRLSADENYSVRDILRTVHCSYQSYSKTVDAARVKGISWPLDDDVTNEELQAFLFLEQYASLPIYAMPDFAYIHKELARSGVKLRLLHEEYINKCLTEGSTPYQYTQFCEKIKAPSKVYLQNAISNIRDSILFIVATISKLMTVRIEI